MTRQKKIFLEESEMPKQWYNLAPDLPTTFKSTFRTRRKSGWSGNVGSGFSNEPD